MSGPSIDSVSPTSGAGGGPHSVTILGSGFTHAESVSVPTDVFADNLVVVDDNTITCDLLIGDESNTPVDITVDAGDYGTGTLEDAFSFVLPFITSVTPDNGPAAGGTPVTISGAGFTGATDVRFSAVFSATAIVVVNDTTITCVTPACGAGLVSVAVDTPAGEAVGDPTEQYTYT